MQQLLTISNHHCTRCDINWARLWEDQDEINDEACEICPQCKTDQFLVAGNDGDGYIMCKITGRITNVRTGEELNKHSFAAGEPSKPFDLEAWRKNKEREQEIVLDAIEAYQETGDIADYRRVLDQLKQVNQSNHANTNH